jgi:hypothetical protein
MFVCAEKIVMQTLSCLWLIAGFPNTLATAQGRDSAPRWTYSTVYYENANACMWAGVPADICRAGYRSAFRQHLRVAPMYRQVEDCENDFYPGECASSAEHLRWSPWLSGFSLVRRSSLAPNADEALEPVTRLYYSEPLYWERDGQGGSHLTTLRDMLRAGQHFEHAISRHPDILPGSALSDRRLARTFEAQRLYEAVAP